MSQRLVRCREGHVYDADAATACPVCGDASTRSNADVAQPDLPTVSAKPPYAVVAIGSVAVMSLIAGAIWLRAGPETARSKIEGYVTAEPHRASQSEQSKPVPPAIANTAEAPGRQADATLPGGASASTESTPPAARQLAVAEKPAEAARPAPPTNIGGPVVVDRELEAAGAAVKSGPLGQPAVYEKYPPDRLARIQQELALSDLVVDAAVTAAATRAIKQSSSREKIALLEALAARGSTSAMVAVANAYFGNAGVPADVERGIRYIEDAAEAGFGPARLTLARMLLAGEIVKPDKPRAILLLIAATRGSTEGAGPLLSGLGIDPDKLGTTSRQVMSWAVEGDRRTVEAARELMTAKISGGSFALAFFGALRSQDPKLKKDVLALARDSVKLGEVGGFHLLSVLSEDGKLAPKNPTEALIWSNLYRQLCPQCTARPERIADLERRADKARLADFNREVESLAISGLRPHQ